MHLRFKSRQMQQRAQSLNEATRVWGEPVARRYIRRVVAIRAAKDFAELQQVRSLRVHPLRGSLAGLWAMDLLGRWRLIFTVDPAADAIQIEEVSNHYDD